MGEVTFDVVASGKIILHALKYPHCAVNGVLLADSASVKSGAKNQDLKIIDAIPLFHHSHYLSPMAEVALTQIEAMAKSNNKVIVGYYAACENYRDNTVDKCPGLKIAEKIVEHFPSAVFALIDNQRMCVKLELSPIKVHRFTEGKWKANEASDPYAEILSALIQFLIEELVQDELVDYDNYLDDISKDWTNLHVEKKLNSLVHDLIQKQKHN